MKTLQQVLLGGASVQQLTALTIIMGFLNNQHVVLANSERSSCKNLLQIATFPVITNPELMKDHHLPHSRSGVAVGSVRSVTDASVGEMF